MLPPTHFSIQSLSDFVPGLPEELLLCPVHALSEFVTRTSRVVNRPRRLFVSSRRSSRDMSPNGIFSCCEKSLLITSWRSNTVFTSFYLKDVHYIFEGVRSLGFWLQQANLSVIVLSTCPLYPRDETANHR